MSWWGTVLSHTCPKPSWGQRPLDWSLYLGIVAAILAAILALVGFIALAYVLSAGQTDDDSSPTRGRYHDIIAAIVILLVVVLVTPALALLALAKLR